MLGEYEIPLRELEELEDKYGIELYVEQYEGNEFETAYYVIRPNMSDKVYVGSTIEEVKEKLVVRYGW